MPGKEQNNGTRFIPERVRIRSPPHEPPPGLEEGVGKDEDEGFVQKTRISHEVAAVEAQLRNLPRFQGIIASHPSMDIQERDMIEERIYNVILSVMRNTRNSDDELTATFDQHDLDPRIFAFLKPQDLSDVMTTTTVIREQGLPTPTSSRFPVQDMRGFVMGVMGRGSPEKEATFDRFVQELHHLYNPSKLLTWYHASTRIAPGEPAMAVPLIELPETTVAEAFPGLHRTPGYHTWIQRYRSQDPQGGTPQ